MKLLLWSQGGKAYPAYIKKKTGYMDWSYWVGTALYNLLLKERWKNKSYWKTLWKEEDSRN